MSSTGKFIGLGLTALRSNFSALSILYKLTFTITYHCQSRCLTCNIWQIKPKNELSVEEISEFAKKNTSFRWIEITGGEPFLRSDIVEIVKAFVEHSKGLYIVTIPTNSLTSHDLVIRKVKEILDAGVPRLSITVSLDGYRELHDKVRGIPGNYDKAVDMFKRLQELQKSYDNLFAVFGYTMSKLNHGQFERTFQEVKKDIPNITYDNFHVNVGQLSEIYYTNIGSDIVADKEMIASEIMELRKRRSMKLDAIHLIENVFLEKLEEYVKTGMTPMRSRSLDASLFMDSYGNVYPSIMWGRKIGNIRDTAYDLRPIWNNGEASEVRKLIKEGREPSGWTACEAYQAIVGNAKSLVHAF